MRSVSLGLVVMTLVGCGGSYGRASSESDATAAQPASAGGAPTDAPAADSVNPLAPPAPAEKSADAPSAARDSASVEGAPSPVAPSAVAPSSVDAGPVMKAMPERPAPGQLTAGVWDDNLNYGFFGPYASAFRQRDADHDLFGTGEMAKARDAALATHGARGELDVQLVLDTTGSMGDELRYLQSEFDSIAATVSRKFPNLAPRWSLVLYRDQGDDYVTRQFDFTADTARFRADLRAQSAGGGGDFPEAVVAAWQQGLRQSWRSDAKVAKIAFWVADAPAHPGEGKQLAKLVRDASVRGVHVYPIASSGIDETAEYQMRATAQRTGGRYVFLTDDSGIGGSHAEPHIPCYAVQKLDTTIVRMIETELTGQHVRAAAADIVRAVGNPRPDGTCQLRNKTLVASY